MAGLQGKRRVLPDLIGAGLTIVFCGTAAGIQSAKQGKYYAAPTNRFWRVLHAVGLTSRQLRPDEFNELSRFGIGLTDLAKHHSGADVSLPAGCLDSRRLRQAVLQARPKFLAFNGKKAAEHFLQRLIGYGRTPETIGRTQIWVLPSTSGAASKFWRLQRWQELAQAVSDQDTRSPN